MKNIGRIDKKQCSGCEACLNACPKKCISMSENEEGFLFPHVDSSICVDCGKCLNVCPLMNKTKIDNTPHCYAAWNNDQKIREKSSSGGVFSLIASAVIADGGVVCGAAFTDSFEVRHVFIETEEELSRLRGSKYVQSSMGFCYSTTRKILASGRKVLFTGTPCQIAGLFSYLGRNYPNLYTQDIICHGVPSRKVWRDYLGGIEKQIGKAISVEFRNKEKGWNAYAMKVVSKNGVYSVSHNEDIYNRCFIRNKTLRLSCYECAFKSRNRPSDITLADFWGVEKKYPNLSDDKGVSLVIVNSEKGARLLSLVADKMTLSETDADFAFSNNGAAEKSAEKPNDREKFFKYVQRFGFNKTYQKLYGDPDNKLINRIKNKIKAIIKGKQ